MENSKIISYKGIDFTKGSAISDGSCFFDSFRQGLEQLGTEVTVEQLRKDCLDFASKASVPHWLQHSLSNDYNIDHKIRPKITIDQYKENIIKRETWGRPDIEGRILCEKYGVKLCVLEKNSMESPEFLYSVILNNGLNNGAVSKFSELDKETICMMNDGRNHFEPLFDMRFQEERDYQFAKNLQKKDDYESAMCLQVQEDDCKYAKTLQIESVNFPNWIRKQYA